MAHEGLHESEDKLAVMTVDSHRAILSLMEELEAVDWYHQRAEACADAGLREILLHNMHEEMEHAAMLLEWLRRSTPRLDEILRTYLFSQGNITQVEKKATGKDGGGDTPQATDVLKPHLTVGSLKGA
ncbi:MAG: ferritin [Sulfuricella sp.]|nr:ferritin [Sulfuricella sp.]